MKRNLKHTRQLKNDPSIIVGYTFVVQGFFFIHFLKKKCKSTSAGSRQRQINEVSKFARTAIESFTAKHLSNCGSLSDIPCRFQSMVDQINDKYPYER